MKRFMRRINRGLVLFIVLIIGFAVFAVSQTLGFRKEKAEIMKLCNEFCTKQCDVLVTPDICYDKSETLTDEQTKAIDDKINSFLSVWTNVEPSENFEYYTKLTKMQDILKSGLYRNARAKCNVESAIYSIADEISATKLSSNYAMVNFECEYTITHTNYVRIPLSNSSNEIYAGYAQDQDYYYYGGDDKYYYYGDENQKELNEIQFNKEIEKLGDQKTNTYITVNYTMYLNKTADGWKIGYIDSWSYGSGSTAK